MVARHDRHAVADPQWFTSGRSALRADDGLDDGIETGRGRASFQARVRYVRLLGERHGSENKTNPAGGSHLFNSSIR